MDFLLKVLDQSWNNACIRIKATVKARWINHKNLDAFKGELSKKYEEQLIVGFAGPGASGKTTVLSGLVEKYSYYHLLNVTTRSPRTTEIDGLDYYFVSEEEFQSKYDNGEFITTVCKSGRGRYGLLKSDVENIIASKLSKTVLIESPAILNYLFHQISQQTSNFRYIIIYLLPKPPILNSLYTYLSTRQNEISSEDVLINHGWRQIEEFSSLICLNEQSDIYVIEGLNPTELSEILGEGLKTEEI